jgi:hypothetical protein
VDPVCAQNNRFTQYSYDLAGDLGSDDFSLRQLGIVHLAEVRFQNCRAGYIRKQDRKLIPAEPRHSVDVTNAGSQPLSHGSEHEITDRMAKRVVHIFEMIQIEVKDREARSASPSLCYPLLGHLDEYTPVRQAR